MHVRLAQQQIGDLMRQHGLLDRGWTQGLDRANRRLGRCQHGLRRLTFSKAFIERNNWTEVRLVALHEIAHALVGPQHGHDGVWRRKCLEIGGDGKRLNSTASTPPHKWTGECPSCGWQMGRDRLTQSARRSACLPCCNRHNGGRFSDRFLLVWRETSLMRLTGANK